METAPEQQTDTPPGVEEPAAHVPDTLPILPTGESVVFPAMVVPMLVRDERSIRLITEVAGGTRMMALFPARTPEEAERPDNLADVGTAASILRLSRAADGSLQLIVRGIARVRLGEMVSTEPYMIGRIEELPEVVVESAEVDALQRSVLSMFARIVELSPALPEEATAAVSELTQPDRITDFIASALNLTLPEKLELLDMPDVEARLRRVSELAARELEVLELGSQIQQRIRAEMDKGQREYYLREQMRQVQRELGELTGEQNEIEELRARIEEANLPEGARRQADEELNRLQRIPAASPEYGIIRTYIDWIVSLPWERHTTDNNDLNEAERILNEDHYDLEKIKERILEYLAVRKLRGDAKGPILCFVGPPGVGKTSLGMSIARALERKFIRISLGGVRDEAEIRGHRRTYIGAMPGRIVQGLRRVESDNPVFMLDEIDKLTTGFQGDPAAALLEVLDPAQNSSFTDHYLDIPFDLSHVLFVATANVLDTIPAPLQDRMEIIDLSGYTEAEKLHIARRYLISRQEEANGLSPGQLELGDDALREVISDFTREAGVRGLERRIGSIARKAAREIAQGKVERVVVTAPDLPAYLGNHRYHREVVEEGDEVGVATGMAWTPVGGDILFVEASKLPGHGHLILTGQLGEVMQESARAAMTYVRARAAQLGVPEDFYETTDFHVHVPAGSIPKDGPSAGITMATALSSTLTGRKVNKKVAMTGEVTLRGRVLPIGGVKDKVLAAHRAGITTIILPKDNEEDVPDIPEEARHDLNIVLVNHMDQVLDVALEQGKPGEAAGQTGEGRRRGPVAARSGAA